MKTSDALAKEEFNKDHPMAIGQGVKSLFRFYIFDEEHLPRLEELFVKGLLYHALPEQLNDPFECKPHFKMPEKPKDIGAVRKEILKMAKKRGINKYEARKYASKALSKPGFFEELINNSALNRYGELRMCSFTRDNKHLLFWSHYADSHRGFCIEFDTTGVPLGVAYKVKYQDDYPKLKFPLPNNQAIFKPALAKSNEWAYEEEYRTFIYPNPDSRLPTHEGKYLVLKGGDIKNVYFGALMEDKTKLKLIDLIDKGFFSPVIWTTSLSKSSFKLEFSEY